MAVSLAISETFGVKVWSDFEIWVWGRSTSLKIQGNWKWRGSIKGAATVLKLGGPSADGVSRGADGVSRGTEGAEVEREPSRGAEGESRSVEGAEGGGAWGGGVPLLTGGGVWGEGRAPSPDIFFIYYLKMVSFGAFWVALPRCMLFRATAQ